MTSPTRNQHVPMAGIGGRRISLGGVGTQNTNSHWAMPMTVCFVKLCLDQKMN
jgi:hypothetical protein